MNVYLILTSVNIIVTILMEHIHVHVLMATGLLLITEHATVMSLL